MFIGRRRELASLQMGDMSIVMETCFKRPSSIGIEGLPFWENGVKFFIVEGPNNERVEFNQYL